MLGVISRSCCSNGLSSALGHVGLDRQILISLLINEVSEPTCEADNGEAPSSFASLWLFGSGSLWELIPWV